MQKLLNNKGSLTVETAILFPVLMVVLLFGYVGVGFYVQYYKVQQCFYDTAEVLSDYAYVYHEKAISKVTAEWRSGLEETLDTALDTFQMDIPEELQGLFDVKTYIKTYANDFLDQAESQLYVTIAHAVFQHYLYKN